MRAILLNSVFVIVAIASPVLTSSWHYNIKDRLLIPSSPILCESGEDISHSINKSDYDTFLYSIKKRIKLLNIFENPPHSIFDVNFVLEHTNYKYIRMAKSKISVCLSKKEVEEILKQNRKGVEHEAFETIILEEK